MRRVHLLLRRREWLLPSLGDLFLVSLIAWLFVAGGGWAALLADGDTGWHIRTGDWILQTGSIPTRDLFSFSRAGEPWHAWEWLSDVIFAALHRGWGLAGVAAFSGLMAACAALVVLRHMVSSGAHALVAVLVVLLLVGASSIHYLARPHVFTLLLLAVSLWMVERDRRQPGRAVWLLVPLSAVWVNLHGGFFALPVCLAALAAGNALEGWLDTEHRAERWRLPLRQAALLVAALTASLANPYGFGLHRHIWSYLRSDWIRNAVEEFQSPRFRSENLLHFELLLLAALLLTGHLAARRRVGQALLVLAWAHLSLVSVRHVPVFAIVAAPLVACELSWLWESRMARQPPQSIGRVLWALGEDLRPGFARQTVWSAVLAGAAILLTPAAKWPGDFPESSFPVSLIRSELSHLLGRRVFTSDQWGDYLIYAGWPRQRVFIDGRSDFYGPTLGREYWRLVEGLARMAEPLSGVWLRGGTAAPGVASGGTARRRSGLAAQARGPPGRFVRAFRPGIWRPP